MWMSKESKREKKSGTKGIFAAAAARKGESTSEFAHEKEHASGKVGERARMALMYAKGRANR
jgi:hypothetical protein